MIDNVANQKDPKKESKKKQTKRPKVKNSEIGLRLVFQPIVMPMFAKIIGYEALIRLGDKKMGNLSPAVFIPIAEKSGLSLSIGNWVFEETAKMIVKMQKKQIKFEYISVNTSMKHFQKKDFIPFLKWLLEEYQIEPSMICLEISELDIQGKIQRTLKKMSDLQEIGFKIVIDDFGTGFGNLANLTKIPADILKLDKSFVDRIVFDKNSRQVTEAIINLAEKLNLEVIVKGVEDVKQQNLLMQMGCQKFQGFLYGPSLKEREILYPKEKGNKVKELE